MNYLMISQNSVLELEMVPINHTPVPLTLTPSTLLVHSSTGDRNSYRQKRVSPGLLQRLTWLEGLEEDAHAVELLTHNSTGEKGRSLTHLLWRVLKTTRKAIQSSRHQKHICT